MNKYLLIGYYDDSTQVTKEISAENQTFKLEAVIREAVREIRTTEEGKILKEFQVFTTVEFIGFTSQQILDDLEEEAYLLEHGRIPSPCLVICQDWTEHERGWGTRPDGHTLHKDEDEHKDYVKRFYEKYHNESSAPDDYTSADHAARIVEVDPKTWMDVQRKGTIWGSSSAYGPKEYKITLRKEKS